MCFMVVALIIKMFLYVDEVGLIIATTILYVVSRNVGLMTHESTIMLLVP